MLEKSLSYVQKANALKRKSEENTEDLAKLQ